MVPVSLCFHMTGDIVESTVSDTEVYRAVLAKAKLWALFEAIIPGSNFNVDKNLAAFFGFFCTPAVAVLVSQSESLESPGEAIVLGTKENENCDTIEDDAFLLRVSTGQVARAATPVPFTGWASSITCMTMP